MFLISSNPCRTHHPEDGRGTHCGPSLLYCWIHEILYCNPKGRRALLRMPSTEGRSVCLCWAPSKPKGPKGGTLAQQHVTTFGNPGRARIASKIFSVPHTWCRLWRSGRGVWGSGFGVEG